MSIEIKRRNTDENVLTCDTVKWVKRTAKITASDGSTVFEKQNVNVPEYWSQLSTDIVASKYFRGSETSAWQVIYRVVNTIASEGVKQGYLFESNLDAFADELKWLLLHQYGCFNSPVLFNVGLHERYGIIGSGGNFAWDERTAKAVRQETAYVRPQVAACFLPSVEDTLESIFDLVSTESRLYKGGSGSGTNFSVLRSKGEPLSSGGTSSGVMSFLNVSDRAAGATKSGGISRRAASIRVLNVLHPEIRQFVSWKAREEDKAHALISAGYSAEFDGEAYTTVGGQNSNNSVRVSDAFMRAVEDDADWSTRYVTSGKVAETFKARDLWSDISEAAWKCADPGLQFHDTANLWNTCSASGYITSTNPCGEVVFLNDTACNLASLNLLKFLKLDGSFDVDSFRHAIRIFIIAQDILVDYGSYPTAKIAENSHKFRPLGLGFSNLGALLMVLGVPYDSDEGRHIAAAITALMTGYAYRVSNELARFKSKFEEYDKNSTCMSEVLRLHKLSVDEWAANNLADSIVFTWAGHCKSVAFGMSAPIWEAAIEDWSYVTPSGGPFRNAQVTCCPPCGTIGLLMGCSTTGIEPDFALVKYKKLSGGGTLKIVNTEVEPSLKRLGYTPEEIDAIIGHLMDTDSIEGAPHLKPEHLPVFDCANKSGNGTRCISPMGHLKMVGAIQRFISGGISKTIQLPHDSKPEDIAEIYMQAWKAGLKGVTVYRDGCKATQPLSTKRADAPRDALSAPEPTTEDTTTGSMEARPSLAKARGTPVVGTRARLPTRRSGFCQEAKVGGHKVYLHTGEYPDGSLGEIFVDLHKDGATIRSLMNAFSIAVSIGLQYGVPLEAFVNQFTFTRFEPQGSVEGHPNVKFATSLLDYLFRVIGYEYLGRTDFLQVKPKDVDVVGKQVYTETNMTQTRAIVTDDGPPCEICGTSTVRNGACYKCLNCGQSMGCS